MSLKKKAFSGAVSTGAGQLAKLALRLTSLAVLARFIGPDEYGLVALVVAVTSVVSVFQDAGLSMATVQAPSITPLQSSSMFWANVGLGALIFAALSGMGQFAAQWYGREELAYLFPLFGLAVFITSFRSQRIALLQRELNFRLLAAAEVGSQALAVVVAIALAVGGYGVLALVALEISQTLFNNIILFLYHSWRPQFRYSWAAIKPLLSFGVPVMLSSGVARLIANVDAIVIGTFLGSAPLGIYNRSQSILKAPMRQFNNSLGVVARSAIFRAAQQQDRFERGISSILQIISFASAVIVLVGLSLAQPIVLIFLGNDWLQCVPIFMCLVPFAFIEPSAVFLNSVLISKGEGGAILKWKLVNLSIGAAAVFAGLPWGMIGVALGSSLSSVFIRFPLLMRYASLKADVPFALLVRSLAPALLPCSLASSFAVYRYLEDPNRGVLGSLVTLSVSLGLFAASAAAFRDTRRTVRLAVGNLSAIARQRARRGREMAGAPEKV